MSRIRCSCSAVATTRTCAIGASEEMARGLPDAELVVFENSAHMMFAEEQDRYLAAVRRFLDRITS